MMDYGENGLFTLKNVSKNHQKLIIRRRGGGGGGGLEIKLSWVEKNHKINNPRGDHYSGLESTCQIHFVIISFYF